MCPWNGRFRDIDKHLENCIYATGQRFALTACPHCKTRFKPRAFVTHVLVISIYKFDPPHNNQHR